MVEIVEISNLVEVVTTETNVEIPVTGSGEIQGHSGIGTQTMAEMSDATMDINLICSGLLQACSLIHHRHFYAVCMNRIVEKEDNNCTMIIDEESNCTINEVKKIKSNNTNRTENEGIIITHILL